MIKRLFGKGQNPQKVEAGISFRLDQRGNPLATFKGEHETLFRKSAGGEWVVSDSALSCSLDLIAGRRAALCERVQPTNCIGA